MYSPHRTNLTSPYNFIFKLIIELKTCVQTILEVKTYLQTTVKNRLWTIQKFYSVKVTIKAINIIPERTTETGTLELQ